MKILARYWGGVAVELAPANSGVLASRAPPKEQGSAPGSRRAVGSLGFKASIGSNRHAFLCGPFARGLDDPVSIHVQRGVWLIRKPIAVLAIEEGNVRSAPIRRDSDKWMTLP